MKILFLARWFPYPTDNGSKLRIYNLLRGISKQHDVTLLSFADDPNTDPKAPEIRAICPEAYVVPWREFDPGSSRARVGLFSLTPRSLIDTFSPEMANKITDLSMTNHYDLVIASQLSMAAYRPYFKEIPAIFEEVEIGVIYGQAHTGNVLQRLRRMFTWLKLRIYLARLLDSFQVCTVASADEQRLIVSSFSLPNTTIEVIPNCIDSGEYSRQPLTPIPNQLIFSGSFRYRPNYEAMLWYVEKVHPSVLEEIPDAQLVITGDHANLSLPGNRNITLAGYVDDIRSLISSSCVSIAPLLTGGGTRLKILEAMAIGTPVISTAKGTEGLMVRNGEHLLIADEPIHFANGVITMLRDQEFRKRISSNARRLVQENYDWSVVMPKFLGLLGMAADR
jgi:glycosyltransferase involved in cell wall biosynthesis